MTDTITLLQSSQLALNAMEDLITKVEEGSAKSFNICTEFAMVAGSLRAALAQQAEQGWVSLNDGLPQPHQMVLVARGKFVTTGSYSPEFGWEWEQLDGEDDDSVATHWMPIPAAPKETTCKQKP